MDTHSTRPPSVSHRVRAWPAMDPSRSGGHSCPTRGTSGRLLVDVEHSTIGNPEHHGHVLRHEVLALTNHSATTAKDLQMTGLEQGARLSMGLFSIVALASLGVSLGASSAWAASKPSPGNMLAVLTEQADTNDAIPFDGEVQFGQGMGLLYETSRFLGSTPYGSYWAILDADANICLASQDADALAMVFSCATVQSFGQRGISSSFYSGDMQVSTRMDAYLVPDSLTLRASVKGLEAVTGNLVAGRVSGEHDVLQFATQDGQVALDIPVLPPVTE